VKIWLIERPDKKIDWDEYTGAVVVAKSPEEALKMLSWGDWDVTITEIDLSTPAIIHEAYNAG